MTAPAINSESKFARHTFFLGLLLLAIAVSYRALGFVIRSAVSVDQYSHILLVLPVSVAFLYLLRARVLSKVSYSKPGGIAFALLAAASAFVTVHIDTLSASGEVSLSVFLFASCCIAAFLFCYGPQAFRVASFPLLFLLLMVPLPDTALARVVQTLQEGSAVASCLLFRLAHIPYVRHGFVIALPKIDIYIAEECSGIRSSMVLLLCSLVLGHLYLKSVWSKTMLMLAALLLTVAKNGLRIFVLSTLGMYVDPSFLSGRLHHEGGFIFFGLAFAALFLLIWLLQKLPLDQRATDSLQAGA